LAVFTNVAAGNCGGGLVYCAIARNYYKGDVDKKISASSGWDIGKMSLLTELGNLLDWNSTNMPALTDFLLIPVCRSRICPPHCPPDEQTVLHHHRD
jgi:hypothetical protein